MTDERNYAFIGDIHSQYYPLYQALEYCAENSLVPVLLGDVFDSRSKLSDSVDVYQLLRWAQVEMDAIILRSNHQDKLERYLRGNNVMMSAELRRTVEDFEGSGVPLTELDEWLNTLPYGFCLRQDGREYRCAHAYFPTRFQVPEYEHTHFVTEVPRKVRQLMLYGPMNNEDRSRSFWWEAPAERDWVRVAGHYHVVHCDDRNLVLDGGCGGSSRSWFCNEESCLVLFDVAKQEMVQFGTALED